MDFTRATRIMLVLLCINSTKQQRSPLFQYIVDANCEQFSRFQERQLLPRVGKSEIDCARACSQLPNCQNFRLGYRQQEQRIRCEVAVGNKSDQTSPPTSPSPTNSSSPEFGDRCYEVKVAGTECDHPIGQRPTSYGDLSADLHITEWLELVNAQIPSTQTRTHMATRNDAKESKMVFLNDTSGIMHAIKTTQVVFDKNRYTGAMAFAIEKDEYGIKPNASLIVYACDFTGKVVQYFLHSNVSYSKSSDLFSSFKIFVSKTNVYPIELDPNNVSKVTEELEKGYETFLWRYSVLEGDKTTLYHVGERMTVSNRLPRYPTQIKRYVQVLGSSSWRNFMVTYPNSPGIVDTYPKTKISPIWFNPLWRKVMFTTPCENLASIQRLLFQGHQLRVSFDGGYYDVKVVVQLKTDVYFMLPAQASGQIVSSGYFTAETMEKKGVVSLSGKYSWCSNPFEREEGITTGTDTVLNVAVFADTKRWEPVLSVFSNGNIALGSVDDLAEAAVKGKDIRALIEWLDQDRATQLTITAVSIKDYSTPGVLVIAESEITWNLNISGQGSVTINSDCHMEKVVVMSSGIAQSLVFNARTRKPIIILDNIKITWFAH